MENDPYHHSTEGTKKMAKANEIMAGAALSLIPIAGIISLALIVENIDKIKAIFSSNFP